MNKQGNSYTIIYASVIVVIVAVMLAFTALVLKPAQTRNIEIDKKQQILSSVNIPSTPKDAEALYDEYIVESYIVNEAGEKVEGNAFNVSIAVQSKIENAAERQLPVFVCKTKEGEMKYILPMYGAGLWGPIWGYVSVNADGNTVYGSTYSHQGETPGLGAKITEPAFQQQFIGKHLFIDGEFKSISVEKKGQKSINGSEQVDAISGGTITSKGVQAMMMNCLKPYQNFLKQL